METTPIEFFKPALVEFDIGGTFKYKPLLGEDELEMDLSFCYYETTEGLQFDVRRFNILKLAHNLKETPFTLEMVKNQIGIEKEYNQLTIPEKINFLKKLSTAVLQKIIEKVDETDYPDLNLKKK